MKLSVVIPAQGAPYAQEIPDEGELEALQKIVGGWIEYVPTKQDVTLYCNEEGKIEGLAPNLDATIHFGSMLMPGDYLAGDVVILGPYDEEGETTSISDVWVAFFGIPVNV